MIRLAEILVFHLDEYICLREELATGNRHPGLDTALETSQALAVSHAEKRGPPASRPRLEGRNSSGQQWEGKRQSPADTPPPTLTAPSGAAVILSCVWRKSSHGWERKSWQLSLGLPGDCPLFPDSLPSPVVLARSPFSLGNLGCGNTPEEEAAFPGVEDAGRRCDPGVPGSVPMETALKVSHPQQPVQVFLFIPLPDTPPPATLEFP